MSISSEPCPTPPHPPPATHPPQRTLEPLETSFIAHMADKKKAARMEAKKAKPVATAAFQGIGGGGADGSGLADTDEEDEAAWAPPEEETAEMAVDVDDLL